MTTLEGKRIVNPVSKTTQAVFPAGDYAELLATEFLPRNYNAVYQGWQFSFSSGSITASGAAGGNGNTTATPATLLVSASPAFAIWNPPGSGKNAVITKVGALNISGFPNGPLYWNYGAYGVGTTATVSTVVPGIAGGSAATAMKVYSGVATTGSAAGLAYKLACGFSQVTSVGSNDGTPFYEDTGGDIIVQPNTWLAICSAGTGTSHVFQVSVSWIEVPV